MSFNLTQELWIPVVSQDWQRRDVSLMTLFKSWETLREIQADNPPTTLALHRFLLAILHRAYQGPRNVDHWEEIQQDNGKDVIAYLNKWRDRFDLLHSECPFMQDPALTEDKAVPIYAMHTMSTSKVFSHEHEWSGYSVSLSEAARLLVRLQSVDITSLRAFYPLQTQGNRSAVNTPTINTANVLICGTTLKETLLLNLIRYDPAGEFPSAVSGEDLPAWETSYAGKPQKQIPNGYIQYLAYPWRRLNLFAEGDRINRLAITMGNSLPDGISAQQWECGIAYKEEKPLRVIPERQLWRDSHSFLQSAEKNHRPHIVGWLAELHDERLVSDVAHLTVFGMSADKAKPLAWSVEKFSAPIIYVKDKEKNKGLGQLLKIAITTAEDHQQVFRSFKGSPYAALAESLKNNDAQALSKSLDGESRYWATLDRKFQTLLRDLPINGSAELTKWTDIVQKAARAAFTESIQSIRNYEARATALRILAWKLADLRMDPEEKAERKAKAAAKKKEKVSK